MDKEQFKAVLDEAKKEMTKSQFRKFLEKQVLNFVAGMQMSYDSMETAYHYREDQVLSGNTKRNMVKYAKISILTTAIICFLLGTLLGFTLLNI